ncbi:diadenylate cyclase CdaA [soil metagenome]
MPALFDNFRLLNLLDVTVIALMLFGAYRLLIGSRAWNVFLGMTALGALWFIAAQLRLTATAWIFANLAPVSLLAIIIVFQPELRAALERVGRGRIAHSSGSDPVQEIMAAVRELATQRQGAIIAVERQTPLAEYGRVGTALGSPVSSALLQTIFASYGPLHDGAVIIKGDVITHAGAIFPLSDKHDGWSVKHGTRHRAALGLAEASDALTIVVSEERGTVSLAQNGALKSDIAPADVTKALRKVYGT